MARRRDDEDTEPQAYDVLSAATAAYTKDLARKGRLDWALNKLTPAEREAIAEARGYQAGRKRGW